MPLGPNSLIYGVKTGSSVHVLAASTLFFDMFNAEAAKMVRVLAIRHIVNLETAVVGVGFEWQVLRTTAAGTGGTALTPFPADTEDAAVPAGVTARLKATGGATAGTSLIDYYTHSEEGSAAPTTQISTGLTENENLLPVCLREKGLVLNPNQGFRINQETNSADGNSSIAVWFTVETY